MTYGIKIDGSDGQFQVDGSTTSTSYFAVAQNATIGGSSPFRIPTSDNWTSSDLVFARPVSGSGTFNSNFVINNVSGAAFNPRPSFNVNAEYIILRSSATAPTDSSLNYGIQVKNDASSPVVIFDSRSSIGGGTSMKGFNIVISHPKSSLLGGRQAANALVTANRTVYQSSASEWDKVFVSVSSGFALGSGWVINGFYFDNVNYRVLFEGFFVTVFGDANRASTGTILAGLVKS